MVNRLSVVGCQFDVRIKYTCCQKSKHIIEGKSSEFHELLSDTATTPFPSQLDLDFWWIWAFIQYYSTAVQVPVHVYLHINK
jgi:hypothetical protein